MSIYSFFSYMIFSATVVVMMAGISEGASAQQADQVKFYC